MGKKTSNQLPILNTQTMACAGFGKGGQIERFRRTDVTSVVQGAKLWQGVWGLCPPEAGALFKCYF